MSEYPFDDAFLKRLEQLKLRAGRCRPSHLPGERTAKWASSGLEHLDIRDYVPGDDFRYVDWNAFARSERLLVKQFHAERALCVHLLVDTSNSMRLGSPAKLIYALQTALALGYVGLSTRDRVAFGLFDRDLYTMTAPAQGKRQLISLVKRMAGVVAAGSTDMREALAKYAVQCRTPGVVIVISDFFQQSDNYQNGILALKQRGFSVRVLQLLAQDELDPPFHGSIKFINVENGESLDVSVNDKIRRAYKEGIQSFCDQIRHFCWSQGVPYHLASTSAPFEDLIFRLLRERQFFR